MEWSNILFLHGKCQTINYLINVTNLEKKNFFTKIKSTTYEFSVVVLFWKVAVYSGKLGERKRERERER